MPPRVQVDASRKEPTLVKRVELLPKLDAPSNPILLLWRRLIDTAVAEATKTECGVPTYHAVYSRWWIEEYRPARSDGAWGGSFECCCSWLGIDSDDERLRLRVVIEKRLRRAAMEFVRGVGRMRRAQVVACLGSPATVGRQYVLAMLCATEEEWEMVVGVDRPEKQPRLFDRVDRKRKRAA